MSPRHAVLVLLAFLFLPQWSGAAPAAPGDTASTVVLAADFNGDTIGLPPDVSLPGDPPGDALTLNQTAGTVRVVSSVDGLTLKPVEMKQGNTAGGVEVRAWTAMGPPGTQRATVRWRSLARDDNPVFLMRCTVRAANGAEIASVDYRPHGALTYDIGATLPVTYSNNQSQQFTIEVDFSSGTTSLSIDGTPVPGFGSVPFLSPADRVGSISFAGDESHPQSLVLDDISVVVFTRDPDRAPSVTAPITFEGEERGTIEFRVAASDPDGEAISSLVFDPSALPAGADATLTVDDASNASGTFLWHPRLGDAGSYELVFTAEAGGGTASAVTRLGIAVFGTSITGTLVWTPEPGEEGTHFVTFTAVDSRGDSAQAVTEIDVLAAGATPASTALLSPGAIQKGPVVSAPYRACVPVGGTVTVTASATDTTCAGVLGARFLAPLASAAPAAGSLTLTADLSETPGATFVVDKDPLITGPAEVSGEASVRIAFSVLASDPDGAALLALDADLGGLPAPNDASFTSNASFTSGVFQWTPGVSDSGSYAVTITATNNRVGSFRTQIHVRGTPSARVFLAGSKRIRLPSNKGTEYLYLEPAGASFNLRDVDATTIKLSSPGTGPVGEIAAIASKTIVIGDRDGNGIADMQVAFAKADLRFLFANLRGTSAVPVTVGGELVSGSTFHAEASIAVSAGNGSFLAAVAPNPLNPLGTLRFTMRSSELVTVRIYDLSGRLVRELYRGILPAGDQAFAIDGRDRSGALLGSGIYFYRIETGGEMETGRFTVLK